MLAGFLEPESFVDGGSEWRTYRRWLRVMSVLRIIVASHQSVKGRLLRVPNLAAWAAAIEYGGSTLSH